jgi:hypothetical protein
MSPQMMQMMQQMDFSQEKVQQQFSELGLKPEDVISKVRGSPDLARLIGAPRTRRAAAVPSPRRRGAQACAATTSDLPASLLASSRDAPGKRAGTFLDCAAHARVIHLRRCWRTRTWPLVSPTPRSRRRSLTSARTP